MEEASDNKVLQRYVFRGARWLFNGSGNSLPTETNMHLQTLVQEPATNMVWFPQTSQNSPRIKVPQSVCVCVCK